MKIAVFVTQYHDGNTSDYVISALRELGHLPLLITPQHLLHSKSLTSFDRIVAIDSGMALPLSHPAFLEIDYTKFFFWSIDFRHNKNRSERNPSDWETVREIAARGGTLLFAQKQDALECEQEGLQRCHWFPLAADPSVWQPRSSVTEKKFDAGFYGNIWDEGRARVLTNLLHSTKVKFAVAQPGKLWKDSACRFLHHCRCGFNVNSYVGSGDDFDVSMRVFEVLSCAIPLVTQQVPTLFELFPSSASFIIPYTSPSDAEEVILTALKSETFMKSGVEARQFILNNHTYKHRAQVLLSFS